jgi:hypothetical protein
MRIWVSRKKPWFGLPGTGTLLAKGEKIGDFKKMYIVSEIRRILTQWQSSILGMAAS